MEWTEQRTKTGHEAGREEEGGMYHSGFLSTKHRPRRKLGEEGLASPHSDTFL